MLCEAPQHLHDALHEHEHIVLLRALRYCSSRRLQSLQRALADVVPN